MAFNPFIAFQRNQKFWMAAVLLLCMITFVFCTGVGGDLSDRLLALVRPSGPAIGSIDGKNFSRNDLFELKRQRDVANEFMRKCADIAVATLGEKIKVEEDKLRAADVKQQQDKEFRQKVQQVFAWKAMRDDLLARLQKPRYFDLGTKLDDVIEFKIWQAQADRLGVTLTEEYLQTLVMREFFNSLAEQQLGQAAFEVRRGGGTLSEGYIRRALLEEYRVHLAQLATDKAQPAEYLRSPQELPLAEALLPEQTRTPMSPSMIWDYYKSKRSSIDIKIIPISVAELAKNMPDPPPAEQEAFFKKYQDKPYDPSSPTPGLQLPPRAKVGFLLADPNSPTYRELAQAPRLLWALANTRLDPLQPAISQVAQALDTQVTYDFLLERTFIGGVSHAQYRSAPLSERDVISPMAAYLARRDARSLASFVGNLAASVSGQPVTAPYTTLHYPVAGYVAWGVTQYPRELEAGLALEVRDRAPAYGVLLAAPASPFPALSLFGAQAVLDEAVAGPTRLPLPVVRQEIEKIMTAKTAEQWARDNMQRTKTRLDKLAGNSLGFRQTAARLAYDYKLLYLPETKEYYDRYNIAKAAELKPLEQDYAKYIDQINFFEGRDLTPERLLRDSDFYKLFFGSERFTAEGLFKAAPWPPVIAPAAEGVLRQQRVRMPEINPAMGAALGQFLQGQNPAQPKGAFDLFGFAEKPALYWKTAEEAADRPKSLKDVATRVIDAWKFEKARKEEALPLARKIAETLLDAGNFNGAILAAQTAKTGRPLIDLSDVAELSPNELSPTQRDYQRYPLPRDTFAYPREDMVQELLQLYDLPKAIQLPTTEGDQEVARLLNTINEELYKRTQREFKDRSKAAGHYVQILTNRPLSEFYVAVVPREPYASRDDFARAFRGAPYWPEISLFRQRGIRDFLSPTDSFVARAQQDEGKRVHDLLVQQLMKEFNYEPLKDEDLRADFDRGS